MYLFLFMGFSVISGYALIFENDIKNEENKF